VEGKMATGLTLARLFAGDVHQDTSSILSDDMLGQY
jgi:hypothetical protein